MFENYRVFETTLAGRPLVVETGKLAQLASGAIEPNPHIGNWWYLNCDYRAYGPAQAVLVPFMEAAIG